MPRMGDLQTWGQLHLRSRMFPRETTNDKRFVVGMTTASVASTARLVGSPKEVIQSGNDD